MKALKARIEVQVQRLNSGFTQALLVGFVFALVFVLFRSQNFTAVDGALRCLGVYQRPEIFFHDNRHLLYPVDVFVWHRFLQLFGISSGNALEFVHLTQIMNGLAAAGCLAIFYYLMRFVTHSAGISLAITAALGFSRTFLLHATNSAEAMMGLFWSFVAVQVAVLALQKGRKAPLMLSGVFLALAMATYQSMILIGPAVAILCVSWRSSEKSTVARAVTLRLLYLLGGAAIGVSLIYSWAYSHSGTVGLAAMVDRFFSVPHVTGITGLEARKIINTPLGLVGNLLTVLPSDFAGIRAFVRQHLGDPWMAWMILATSGFFGFLVVSVARCWKHRDQLSNTQKVALITIISGLLVALAGPVYVDPIYDKLWLLPLACLLFLLGLVIKAEQMRRSRSLVIRLGVALLAVQIFSNLISIIPQHFRATPYLSQAQQVAQVVKPEDVVISGWDGVSTIYEAMHGHPGRVIILPMAAGQRGSLVISEIQQAVNDTRQKGGQVYFLGVLDQTEESWTAFLGERRGIPYNSFDSYRLNARVVADFEQSGWKITLRRLGNPSYGQQMAANIGARN